MKKSMTLVETVVYTAILAIMATSFLTMSINMMSLRTKSTSQEEVASNLRFISQKINYEIRNAVAISATTASSITLTMADSARNPTIFSLSSGDIRMGFGSSGSCPTSSPCVLNSSRINISAFTVTNLSSGNSLAQNVRYTLTGNFINNTGRADFAANGSITDSIELR